MRASHISLVLLGFLQLYQLYQGFKKTKKFFLFLYKKVYTIVCMSYFLNKTAEYLIIFCILTLFCLWYILIILVNFLQEGVHIALKFFVRHFKLLKKSIFGTH